MNPAAYCFWNPPIEYGNIEDNIQNTFKEQGFESSSIYTMEKDINKSYENFKTLQEYAEKSKEYQKSSLTKKILNESQESKVIYPEAPIVQNRVSLQDMLNNPNAKNLIGEDCYNVIKNIRELELKHQDIKNNRALLNQIGELLPFINPSETVYTDFLTDQDGEYMSIIKKLTIIAKDTQNIRLKHYIAMYYYNSEIYTDLHYNMSPDLQRAEKMYMEIRESLKGSS